MAAETLWVEKDGKRELHTALNARDLLNNAGWVVSDDQSNTTTERSVPVAESAVVEDETVNDDVDEGEDDVNQDDATADAPSVEPQTHTDEFGNTVTFTFTPLDDDEAPAPVVSSDETPQSPPPPADGGTIPSEAPPLNDDKAPIDIIEKTTRDIQSLNKVELEAYAHKEFGFAVDRRHSEPKIRAQILGLAEAQRVSPKGL